MPAFDHAISATRGARSYQEDSALLWPWEGGIIPSVTAPANGSAALVAVLADGMGGHAGGALASRTVCETFVRTFASASGSQRERLVSGLREANGAIAAAVAQDPALDGMGSTLIAAVFGQNGVEWVSVGDSPLLLYRRGEVALLNEDHSLAPELDRLAEAGNITVDEARRDPRRHMLRSAVTGDNIDLVDISRRPLQLEAGDYIILASDGLQTLELSEIERVVSAFSMDGAGAVANALIREVEAMRDPHQDNATVVAVRLLTGDAAPRPL